MLNQIAHERNRLSWLTTSPFARSARLHPEQFNGQDRKKRDLSSQFVMRFVEQSALVLRKMTEGGNQMSDTKTKSIFGSVIETLAIVGLMLHALLILGAWNLLPASIPVHYNLAGEANAWGDRSNLFLLFGLSILVYLGLTWLGRYPHKFNYPWQVTADKAERQYNLARNFLRAVKCEIVWLFAIISLQTIGISLGLANGLGSFFVILVIAVTGLTAIGYMAIASRSTFGDVR